MTVVNSCASNSGNGIKKKQGVTQQLPLSGFELSARITSAFDDFFPEREIPRIDPEESLLVQVVRECKRTGRRYALASPDQKILQEILDTLRQLPDQEQC